MLPPAKLSNLCTSVHAKRPLGIGIALVIYICLGSSSLPADAGNFRHSEIAAAVADLQSNDLDLKRNAAKKVAKMGVEGKEAIPALIAAMSDSDPGVKEQVAIALDAMGPDAKDAAPVLIEFLQNKTYDSIRGRAAMALGDIGPAAASISVPALITVLDDPESGVASSAVRALADIGPSAKAALPDLVALMATENVALRNTACFAILQIGVQDDNLNLVLPMLSDEIDSVRSCAARTIANSQCEASSAIPVLLKLVDDPQAYVRVDAYNALKRLAPNKKVTVPGVAMLKDYGQESNALWYNDWTILNNSK
ncbi:MAG: HEAT repeat domain-containing protein [Candidatus Obscuribacterales bacterium]|nr:HEAT repeat domain-containing protein [Candidatus Obscuribacterales bacterium]